ncbi:MAG TPA: hypothetical protein VEC37_19250, partial [Bacillota bacterium]|nr:hypothetical protein [Bacillota bacterium]
INPHAEINPEKAYRLQVWDYDLPLRNCDYRQYLQKAVAGFQQKYPNIQVELRFLDLVNGPAEMEQALERGDPPDLYCSAFTIPRFNLKYQIPVGPYFEQVKLDSQYSMSIQRLVQVDGVLCCFPRWLRMKIWVGNRPLLTAAGLDADQINKNGWTWSQLFAIKDKLPAGTFSITGNFIPLGVMRQILPNNCYVEQTGQSGWNWLQQLKETQRLPDDFNSNMFERFITGKVMLLAGVTPRAAQVVGERLIQKGAGWEPVVLPAPELSKARMVHAVEPGVICVFRNPRRRGGSDHLTAAVKLGEFLSRYQDTTPWEEMMVIPATRSGIRKWEQNQGGSRQYVAALECMVNRNSMAVVKTGEAYQENVAAILHQYLTGKVTHDQTIQKLKEEMYCD